MGGLRGPFNRLFFFVSVEEMAHWPARGQTLGYHVGPWSRGLLHVSVCVCVCVRVLSARIYAKGAALPVPLQVAGTRQPDP